MKKSIFLFLLSCSTLFSFEKHCPYGCGQKNLDPDITEIGLFFKQCLEELKLTGEKEFPDKRIDSNHTRFSLISNYYLFFDSLEGSQRSKKRGMFSWAIEDEPAWDEDEWDAYVFTYRKYNLDRDLLESKEFTFENPNEYLDAFYTIEKNVDSLFDANQDYLEKRIKWRKKDLAEVDDCSHTRFFYDSCYYGFNRCTLKQFFKDNLQYFENEIIRRRKEHSLALDNIRECQSKIEKLNFRIFDYCIQTHQHPGIYYQRGMLNYSLGNTLEVLEDIKKLIEKSENVSELSAEMVLLKGQSESELGLYHDAIISLSEYMQKNPENKEVYFERACAYFETGDFDLSIKDYLASEIKPNTNIKDSPEFISYSLGVSLGILKGSKEAATEFIPSALSSLQGIGHGLWAFVQDPIQITSDFADAVSSCINFIRKESPQKVLQHLVPELKELIDNWDNLKENRRGEIAGYIIGKYGVDIFAGAGIVKGMKAYRNLKKANALLTLEAIAKSEKNRSLIKLEAIKRTQTRKEVLQHANLKIQWDKQGKHIVGHKNYNASRFRSICTCSNPEELMKKFAGKGMRQNSISPGKFGYQEIVNFKQPIGYYVIRETGEKMPTNWGKIHYAKDGAHIVPTKPRKF